MSDETGFGTCVSPLCKVALSGKCIEGLDVTACKNYRMPSMEALPTVTGDDQPASERPERTISLAEAIALSPQNAEMLLRACSSRVIAVIGPNEAGKTSLISTLYDLFQQGPLDGQIFKGSQTFHAFETACHHARTASLRAEAYTERTELQSDLRFYHLELMRRADRYRTNLLLADRSGEFYLDIPNEPQTANTFVELRRADSIAVLVDGARLADPQKRHTVRPEILRILQGITDAGALGGVRRLAVVLTKLDKVSASPKAEALKKSFSDLYGEIGRRFAGAFESIAVFEIAARPCGTGFQNGQGVSELFAFWMSTSPAPAEVSAEVVYDRCFQSPLMA